MPSYHFFLQAICVMYATCDTACQEAAKLLDEPAAAADERPDVDAC